jgi:transposase
MEIIGGLDVHRKQLTFDYLQTETGEVQTGQIRPATRENLRSWLSRFDGKQAAFALEATTGWRFVVEELQRAGCEPHLWPNRPTRGPCEGQEEASQDRQAGCQALEGFAPSGTAAGVVDPSRTHPGSAPPREGAQEPGR